MKILSNKKWKEIERKLAENEKTINWWVEKGKKVDKHVEDLTKNFLSKEAECRQLKEQVDSLTKQSKAVEVKPAPEVVTPQCPTPAKKLPRKR